VSESQKKYPRVLVVTGYGFNQASGSGITLTNLFEGWPADRLAIIHADVNGNTPGIVKYEFIPGRQCVIPWTSIGVRWRTRDEIAKSAGQSAQGPKAAGSQRGYYWVRTVANTLLKWTGLVGLVERYSFPQETIDILRYFRADIIYMHPSSISLTRLAIDIKRKLNAPLVVHIMDDYPHSLYTEGFFAKLVSIHMNSLMKKLFAESSLCLGISLFMCSEYSKRYNIPFSCFHNPVNPVFLNNKPRRELVPLEKNGNFRLVYVGRVGWGVAAGLKDISEAVKELANSRVQLAIYANDAESVKRQYGFLRSTPSNVTISESPKNADGIAKILHSADALVLPVDFDEGSIRAIRLSMPTKVPAYLSSGVPILLYGSEKVGFVAEAIEEGWAYVVKVRSKKTLKNAIIFLASSSIFRSKIVDTAFKKAKFFNSEYVREGFREAIAKAATERNQK